jgi:predicted DNA-binding protein (MmcQ/YjbR family)
MAGSASERDQRRAVLAYALGLPDAWEDHPWGESVAKVGKKVFMFAGSGEGEHLRISVKLPVSVDQALGFPGSEPTGYGLGRAGWVTVTLGKPPPGLVEDWIDESYRAIAPKRLVARLDELK